MNSTIKTFWNSIIAIPTRVWVRLTGRFPQLAKLTPLLRGISFLLQKLFYYLKLIFSAIIQFFLQLQNGANIQTKIIMWGGACLLILAGVLITYSGVMLRVTAINATRAQAIAGAQAQANIVTGEIETALEAARMLAQTFESIKSDNIQLSRDDSNALLKRTLYKNPNFAGIYTVWESDAFDGNDAQFINQPGHDETGRFIPHWLRDEDNNLLLEPMTDYELTGFGDYYQIPKRTMAEAIMDPYIYLVGDETELITSLVTPIIVDGTFYGAVGIDVRLSFLQKMADNIDIYNGTGELQLISHRGALVGITGQPRLVGERVTDIFDNYDETLNKIQHGENFVDDENDALKIFVPLKIGTSSTPWSVNLNIPKNEITGPATRMVWQMVAIGTLVSLIVLGLLWFLAGKIGRPLTFVAQIISNIGLHGNLNRDIPATAKEKIATEGGEVGQLGQALIQNEKYLTNLAYNAKQVADGDLSIEITPLSDKDELGNAFAEMIVNLRKLIGQVTTNAHHVSQSADYLAASASQSGQVTQQIAAATHEQAGAIAESVQLTDQMAQTIEQISINLHTGADNAKNAAKIAKEGVITVENSIISMQQIKTKVTISAQKVREMGVWSEQISSIVDTIDDIAGQTNLLALNAAIEAAHAGEHGRGFAIVADEVRKLANKSTEATREIGNLIKIIQKSVGEAIQAMESGSSEVETGVSQVNHAGESLTNILQATDNVNLQVQQIATATEQLYTSSNGLVETMNRVSAVVQENTAATEEMAAQVEEMTASAQSSKDISDELMLMVSQFKLSSQKETAQQIQLFKDSHIRYVALIQNILNGKTRVLADDIETHTDCILGQWYYRRGQSHFGQVPQFINIEQPHIEFHRLAREAVAAYQQGKTDAAQQRLYRVKQLSTEIADMLDRLCHDTNCNSHQTAKPCEFLDKCGFFNNFSRQAEVIKSGVLNYCTNKKNSDACERKKYRRQTGHPPPDNMTPQGKTL